MGTETQPTQRATLDEIASSLAEIEAALAYVLDAELAAAYTRTSLRLLRGSVASLLANVKEG